MNLLQKLRQFRQQDRTNITKGNSGTITILTLYNSLFQPKYVIKTPAGTFTTDKAC